LRVPNINDSKRCMHELISRKGLRASLHELHELSCPEALQLCSPTLTHVHVVGGLRSVYLFPGSAI
jgi:hypothetical protein